jgi:hypothetical protein
MIVNVKSVKYGLDQQGVQHTTTVDLVKRKRAESVEGSAARKLGKRVVLKSRVKTLTYPVCSVRRTMIRKRKLAAVWNI